jgi:hypothetical protein
MVGRNNHAPTKSRSNNNQQQQQCDSGSRHAIPGPVQHPTSGLTCTATSSDATLIARHLPHIPFGLCPGALHR